MNLIKKCKKNIIVKIFLIIVSIYTLILFNSCFNNPGDSDEYKPPTLPLPVFPSPYNDPSWSADGQIIVFQRMKITTVNSLGAYSFDTDSTGIWAINSDGTNMRLLLQGINLYSPELSPDGKWIVYEAGGQIYKVLLISGEIDTSNILQLTTEGNNFFPTWSPDGDWIAYDSNKDSPSGVYFIWMIDSAGKNKRKIANGRIPDWSIDGEYIICIGFHNEIYKVKINNISNAERLTYLNELNIYETDNRYPKYSNDGTNIAFSSQIQNGKKPPQVWVMNANGTNLKQLTTYGGEKPDWSTDGRIIFVHYNGWKMDINNGTLWIMDSDGSNKWQLTYNHDLIFDSN